MATTMREAWTDERLDDLNVRVDDGFARMETRFDRMEARFDARFEKVDERFERMEERFDARFDSLQRTLIHGLVALVTALLGIVGIVVSQII